MAVTRLAFETAKAYWRKVHKENGDVQHFRVAKEGDNAGLARAKKQQSYAAASSHRQSRDKRLDRHTFKYYQSDQSSNFTTYSDAVQVGYNITPSISFNSIKDSIGRSISIRDVYEFLVENYKELHEERERYYGAFWHLSYIVNYEDMANRSHWNSGIYRHDENKEAFWLEDFANQWEHIMQAYDSYNDVIITSQSVNFRQNGLEL